MGRYCEQCGQQLDESAMFCTVCGAKVNKAPAEVAKKPKRKRTLLGVMIAVLLVVAILGVAAWLVLPMLQTVTVSEFASDEIYFLCEEESVITFTAKVASSETLSFIPTTVELVKGENEVVGRMHDDGENGDAIADDGMYTLQIDVEMESEEIVSESYQCKVRKNSSDPITIYYFPLPTAKSVQKAQEDFNTVKSSIWEIEAQYADSDGYVPKENWEDLFEDITDQIDEWIDDEIVLHYVAEEDSIYIKFVSGRGSVYSPAIPNTDGIGSDVSMQVITCQPQFTDMGGTSFGPEGYTLPDDVAYVLEMLDVSGTRLDNSFDNYTFAETDNYDNDEVTLDVINSFGKNQVILWHGHGYYNDVVKSSLVTGELFDWTRYCEDTEYYANYVTNRCVSSYARIGDPVIITSKYIGHYCGDMDNSFVYLAACCSGQSPELANSFLGKGAAAVVANSETIYRAYNVVMLYETVRNMTLINKDTNNYYTLSEALAKAKEVYGENDGDPRYYGGSSYRATPLIFGGSAANGYRFREATGTLSGKICQAADRIIPILGAKVNVYKNNKLYQSTEADENGNYAVDLLTGEYYIEISADGYLGFASYATVQANMVTFMETFLLILESEDTTGIAGGTIYHSFTGSGIEDVTLSFVKDWNNPNTEEIIETTTTDSDGKYSIELPLGNYTVIAEKEDYVTITFNIIVQAGETGNQNGTITPVVSGDDYLITLTWGENPEDLDCHVEGYLSDGYPFHVDYHYSEHQDYDPNYTILPPPRDGDDIVCRLDCDDIESYGPEHITLKTTTKLPYYFYVHHYKGTGTISTSGAKVTVHQGNALIAEFNVPIEYSSDEYWNVFAIKDGEIIVNNTMTDEPNTSYAD